MKRKSFLKFAISSLLAGSWSISRAEQGYPVKPIKVLIGFPAGSSVDIFARQLTSRLGPQFDQPIIVDNRPGAAGTIAASILANSPADGYTFGVVSSHFAASPTLFPVPYSITRDFTPIGLHVLIPLIVVTSPELGVKNIADLVALAKSKPNALSYGSTGSGGISHLCTEMFKATAGIQMVHVPYKNDVDAQIAVMRRDVDLQFAAPSSALPLIRAGKLHALAWSGQQRSSLLPEVPTIAESGYKDFSAVAWYGSVGPKGMPAVVVDRISRALRTIVASNDLSAQIRAEGMMPVTDFSPEQFRSFVRDEAEKWAGVISRNGIKLD